MCFNEDNSQWEITRKSVLPWIFIRLDAHQKISSSLVQLIKRYRPLPAQISQMREWLWRSQKGKSWWLVLKKNMFWICMHQHCLIGAKSCQKQVAFVHSWQEVAWGLPAIWMLIWRNNREICPTRTTCWSVSHHCGSLPHCAGTYYIWYHTCTTGPGIKQQLH